jgi:predicted PurR-regulated permease PerM
MQWRYQVRRRNRRRENELRLIAWGIAVLALIAVVSAAKLASEIVAPTVLAGLFSLTLAPLVAALERPGIPGPLAAASVVGACVFVAAGGAYLLAPSAEEWRLRAPSIMRSLERNLRDIEREIEKGVDKATAGAADDLGGQKSATEAVIESGQKLATDALLSTPEALATFLYIALLCFFLLSERATLRRFALSVCTDWRMRLRLAQALRDMRRSVGGYLLMISLINAGLGLAAGCAFWLLGLPNAPLWSAMVAVLNFMPYLGPLIANVVVFAIGFATFGDAIDALYPVLALVSLNVVEGQVVTPLVVGRRSGVGPLSVFLAVAFGAWLWGALGALVATPLLIVVHRLGSRMMRTPSPPPRRMPGASCSLAA